MKKNKEDVWGFSRGLVVSSDCVYLVAYSRELEEQNIHMNVIFIWDGEWYHFDTEWPVVAICYTEQPEESLFCLGEKGEVKIAKVDGIFEENIDASQSGPAYFGNMRDMKKIGESIYAVGMRRQVYKLSPTGNWTKIDHGVLVPNTESSFAGFNSVDGFGENDIYAVGWLGEIWHYDGQHWKDCPSPTDLKLQSVKCMPDGLVYCVGQSGIVLKGRGESWEIIEHDVIDEQIWSLEWYKEKCWLATKSQLFVLEDGKLSEVDVGIKNATFGWLHAKDGLMCSTGDSHILMTSDGKKWEERVIPTE